MRLWWSALLVGAALPSIPCDTLLAVQVTPVGRRGTTVAFVDVTVIPMDREQVLPHQTIVVHDSMIVQFGPTTDIPVPARASRVDGRGKYLLPGFGDMQMVFFPAKSWDVGQIEPALACYVAHGVTTVRTALHGGQKDTFFLHLRTRVASGAVLGPRMYFVRPVIDLSDEEGGRPVAETAESLAAFRAAGIDFVKVASRNYTSSRGSGWIDSVAAAARRTGLRIVGPVPDSLGLAGALGVPYADIDHLLWYLDTLVPNGRQLASDGTYDSRVYDDRLLHWDSVLRAAPVPIDQGRVAALAAATRQAGVWNVPTQAQTEQMIRSWSGAAEVDASPVVQAHRRLIKALADSGAGLLLGTGSPAWALPRGVAVPRELDRLVAAGLTPYQALAATTSNVAAFLGTLAESGTIGVGKRADLVLLDGNPLEDIGRTAEPAGVMVNGRWLPRRELAARFRPEACR